MTHPQQHRSTARKLAIFRECFTGLTTAYGTYDPGTGRVRQVKRPVTEAVLLGHLQGKQPYGVYLLDGSRTRAVAVDFDVEDPWLPLQFHRQAAHYGIATCIERSKSKGWHAWVFFRAPGIPAAKARAIARLILSDIDALDTEVFPKHDRLAEGVRYGNFINAPLFGRLVPQGRTVFVDIDQGMRPFADQWNLLEHVRRPSEELIDEILEINDPADPEETPAGAEAEAENADEQPPRSLGLLPCAQRMLAEGVSSYQRVACFRLAIQLRKAGLPQDVTIAALEGWAAKNRPPDGKRIITPEEIAEQTRSAFAHKYRGCGCEHPAVAPYCVAECPLRSRNQIPTNPAAESHC